MIRIAVAVLFVLHGLFTFLASPRLSGSLMRLSLRSPYHRRWVCCG